VQIVKWRFKKNVKWRFKSQLMRACGSQKYTKRCNHGAWQRQIT